MITLRVTRQLAFPKGGTANREMPVLLAEMPKAAIHKNQDTFLAKGKIWPDGWRTFFRRVWDFVFDLPPPAPDFMPAKNSGQRHFRPLVSARTDF
jgi:hypothetical protein